MSDQAPLPPRSDPADSFTMQVLAAIYYHKEAALALLARGVGPDFFKHEDCRTVAQWVLLGKKEPPPDDVAVALQRDSATTKSIAESLMMYRQPSSEDAVSDVERHTADYVRARADGEWHGFVPGQNTIRAPIESGFAGNEWDPVPIEDLGPAVPPDWVWPGYLARQHITLFTGLWKAGKTTLVSHLLRDVASGGGLVGDAVSGARVLVVTEEGSTLWTRRRDDLQLGGGKVDLLIRPFMAKPDNRRWQAFIDYLAGLVRNRRYALIILDTLASVWPVMNENDASEVGAALMPLRAISDSGPAVLLIHHPRKGEGQEGQATRGSGALPGFVDVIIEMRRYAKDDNSDCRRVLTTYSRFDESPPEAVLELGDGGYVVLGDKARVNKDDRLDAVEALLPTEGEGATPEEIHQRWPTEPKPSLRSLQSDLPTGAASGRWVRTGSGRRGSSFRYLRATQIDSCNSTSLGARIESKPANPPAEPGKEVA